MFSHCFEDLICIANSFGLSSGLRNMERSYSAVHMQAMISKSNSETTKEMLSSSTADIVSSRIEVVGDTVGEEMDWSPIERSWATSWSEGIEGWNKIEAARMGEEAEGEWARGLEREKEVQWPEKAQLGAQPQQL